MTNPQIQRVAVVLQVSGFFPVLIILLAWHPAWAVALVVCFTVHLTGDVLFFLANRN